MTTVVARVKALYDYTAADSSQITIATGDIIEVFAKDGSGWWTGVCNGQNPGIFPANYTEELPADDSEIPSNGTMYQMKVLYAYAPDPNSEEAATHIKINEGDIVNVLSEDPSGWNVGFLEGTSSDASGFFPSNYCEKIDVSTEATVAAASTSAKKEEESTKKEDSEPEKNTAKEPRKKESGGNGGDGDNFSDISSEMSAFGEDDADTAVSSKPSEKIKETADNSNGGSNNDNSSNNDKDHTDDTSGKENSNNSNATDHRDGDAVIMKAVYDYCGSNEQVTINEGDLITVLEDDGSGWAKGRVHRTGDEGLFPVNFCEKVAPGTADAKDENKPIEATEVEQDKVENDAEVVRQKKEEEAERMRKEEEEKEAEAERKRKEEEEAEAERKRKEETEKEVEKEAKMEAERKRKEEEEAEAERKRREDEEKEAEKEAERKRKEEEEAEAERKRKEEEEREAERKRKEEEEKEAERKRKEEEEKEAEKEAKRKRREEEEAEAERKRKEEEEKEAECKRKEEEEKEAERKRKEEEDTETERKRKEEEVAAVKKHDEGVAIGGEVKGETDATSATNETSSSALHSTSNAPSNVLEGSSSLLMLSAACDFVADNPDALSFSKGEMISVVKVSDDGTWTGNTSSGIQGTFSRDHCAIFWMEAGYDYVPQDVKGHLPIAVGDIIGVVELDDSGWGIGRIDEKYGMFPSNYCKKIANPYAIDASTDIAETIGAENAHNEGVDGNKTEEGHGGEEQVSAKTSESAVAVSEDDSVAAVDDMGRSALHLAAESGDRKQLESILLQPSIAADLGRRDNDGFSALHYAASRPVDDPSTVRLLIEHGADVSAKDNLGRTPLHLAAADGHLGVISVLVRGWEPANPRGIADGWEPSEEAGDIRVNYKKGEHVYADASIADNRGETAADVARVMQNKKAMMAMGISASAKEVDDDNDCEEEPLSGGGGVEREVDGHVKDQDKREQEEEKGSHNDDIGKPEEDKGRDEFKTEEQGENRKDNEGEKEAAQEGGAEEKEAEKREEQVEREGKEDKEDTGDKEDKDGKEDKENREELEEKEEQEDKEEQEEKEEHEEMVVQEKDDTVENAEKVQSGSDAKDIDNDASDGEAKQQENQRSSDLMDKDKDRGDHVNGNDRINDDVDNKNVDSGDIKNTDNANDNDANANDNDANANDSNNDDNDDNEENASGDDSKDTVKKSEETPVPAIEAKADRDEKDIGSEEWRKKEREAKERGDEEERRERDERLKTWEDNLEFFRYVLSTEERKEAELASSRRERGLMAVEDGLSRSMAIEDRRKAKEKKRSRASRTSSKNRLPLAGTSRSDSSASDTAPDAGDTARSGGPPTLGPIEEVAREGVVESNASSKKSVKKENDGEKGSPSSQSHGKGHAHGGRRKGGRSKIRDRDVDGADRTGEWDDPNFTGRFGDTYPSGSPSKRKSQHGYTLAPLRDIVHTRSPRIQYHDRKLEAELQAAEDLLHGIEKEQRRRRKRITRVLAGGSPSPRKSKADRVIEEHKERENHERETRQWLLEEKVKQQRKARKSFGHQDTGDQGARSDFGAETPKHNRQQEQHQLGQSRRGQPKGAQNNNNKRSGGGTGNENKGSKHNGSGDGNKSKAANNRDDGGRNDGNGGGTYKQHQRSQSRFVTPTKPKHGLRSHGSGSLASPRAVGAKKSSSSYASGSGPGSGPGPGPGPGPGSGPGSGSGSGSIVMPSSSAVSGNGNDNPRPSSSVSAASSTDSMPSGPASHGIARINSPSFVNDNPANLSFKIKTDGTVETSATSSPRRPGHAMRQLLVEPNSYKFNQNIAKKHKLKEGGF